MTTYAITGATGQLGGLAAGSLRAAGVDVADIVAIVRREEGEHAVERGSERPRRRL